MVRGDVGVRHHVRPLEIAAAQKHVGLKAVRKYQYLLVRHSECVQQRDQLPGARLVVVEVIDDDQRILASARVERALSSERAQLTRHRLRIIAAGRTEDSAATDPVRSTPRALTGATGSLLLPRLLVTPDHQTASLGVGEAQTLVREVRFNSLMHHRHVDRSVEEISRKINALALGSTGGERSCLQS